MSDSERSEQIVERTSNDMHFRTHVPIYYWRQKLKDRKKINFHFFRAGNWLLRFHDTSTTNQNADEKDN